MKIIVIGTSAGGVSAIQELLFGLPSPFPLAIIIVQHISEKSRVDLRMLFSERGRFDVWEAEDKMPIEPAKIYFAPPGYHLLIEKDGAFALSTDDAVHFSRPSIDVLFESTARALKSDVIGVLLTGASRDGATGLHAINLEGGVTFVQDPRSAESPTMPQAAIDLFKPNYVLTLAEIAFKLSEIAEVIF
jgi:two-component system chemotaxis response regulator CheB